MRGKQGSWEWVRKLRTKDFRRLTGVKPSTFKAMVRCVEAWEAQKKRPGRPSKLSCQDRVLMTLEYLRDYPTLFRLGFDWGVDETTAGRVVRKVERILLESGEFRLPGKRALGEGPSYEVIAVDVGEIPVQRPQKNSAGTPAARKDATP